VVQAREELGEEEEQEVADEQKEVERREGAEEERRYHCTSWFHAAGGRRRSVTKPLLVESEAEAMRRSLRAKHLLQHRHTGTPAAAARIAHLPRLAESVIRSSRERPALCQRGSSLWFWVDKETDTQPNSNRRWCTQTDTAASRAPPALFEGKVAVRDG